MARIDAFFRLMHEQGASDLHLVAGQPPMLRIRGDMERVKYKVLDNDDLRKMLYEITAEDKIKVFEETGDVDFSYEVASLARYRANYFMQRAGIGAVFREIPNKIKTCEQLGLPPVISNLATLPRGLVLITGPTGSGKTTTLAAIVDEANRKRKDHIITIEDPIEFVHQSRGQKTKSPLGFPQRFLRPLSLFDISGKSNNADHLAILVSQYGCRKKHRDMLPYPRYVVNLVIHQCLSATEALHGFCMKNLFFFGNYEIHFFSNEFVFCIPQKFTCRPVNTPNLCVRINDNERVVHASYNIVNIVL